MPISKTTYNENAIRNGSGLVEIGSSFSDLTDLGLVNKFEFEEAWTVKPHKASNGAEYSRERTDWKGKISFNLIEIDLDNIEKLDSAYYVVSEIAGSPTGVTNESKVLTGVNAAALVYKNGANTVVTSITVTNASGTPYTLNSDYTVSVNSTGYTQIARTASSTITTGGTVKVNYSYTPSTSKTLTVKANKTMTPLVLRFTNINSGLTTNVYKCYINKGFKMTYTDDEDAVNIELPVEIEAIPDYITDSNGILYETIDTQNV